MQLINGLLQSAFILSLVVVLAGCPGIGDRVRSHETATVSSTHDALCFQVANPEDYQPSFIMISPREIPLKERKFIVKPDLSVQNGQMCIPYSFYPFPEKGQLIIDYVLSSSKKSDRPRHVIVGIEMTTGVFAQTIPLNNYEF